MFSRIWTKLSTKSCSAPLERLQTALRDCDAVVIGAGAGLSTSAGFVYTDERFKKYFSDFAEKYDIKDMYSGGFYPFATPEEHWAYWSRYIYINRYMDAPKPVYETLLKLVADKDYFVITTNVDHCFQKAGFDKKRLFYTQGDYGLFQCSEPCCQETFDNEAVIREMVKRQKDMKVPTELLPVCPHCGKPLTMNLRSDNKFVEDEGWHRAAERYGNFLRCEYPSCKNTVWNTCSENAKEAVLSHNTCVVELLSFIELQHQTGSAKPVQYLHSCRLIVAQFLEGKLPDLG